jgi:hypothetical protein
MSKITEKYGCKTYSMSNIDYTGVASIAKQKDLDEKDTDKVHKSINDLSKQNPYMKKHKKKGKSK